MKFSLLGTVEARDADSVVDLGRRQERCMAGVLLIEPGRPVSADRLADLLWDGAPPPTARRVLQVYATRLRARLAPHGVPIVTGRGLYSIDVDPNTVDYHRFRTAVLRAPEIADSRSRALSLRAALVEWRGPLLGTVGSARLRERLGVEADETWVTALQRCGEAYLEHDDPDAAIGLLASVAGTDPVRENLVATLMTAYAAAGRKSAAVALFHEVRDRLADDTGLDPHARLQAVFERIVRDEVAPVTAQRPATVSRLPRPPSVFVGRRAEFEALDRAHAARAGNAPVLVVTGAAGSGKTAAVLAWVRRRAEEFPDGEILVDMRAFARTAPATPVEAMTRVLYGLGVDHDRIPADFDGVQALYHRTSGDRRMVLVFDDAAGADQVRAVLPTGPHTLTVITSRHKLRGLAARDDAFLLDLDALVPDDAVDLLTRLIPGASPADLAELAAACAHLPLFLRIAATNAAAAGGVAALTATLRGRRALDALAIDEDPLATARAALDLSYESLGTDAARLFRALGHLPGRFVTPDTAGALLDREPAEAHVVLTAVADVHLATVTDDRYSLHDLVREFAGERADSEDPAGARAAIARLVVHYSDAAASLTDLSGRAKSADRPRAKLFDDLTEAMTWFDGELANLVAVIERASTDAELAPHTWDVARDMISYFWARRTPHEWFSICENAVAAARRYGGPADLGRALNALAVAHWGRHQVERAEELFVEALALFRRIGETQRMGGIIGNLAAIVWIRGDIAAAATYAREARRLARRFGLTGTEANSELHLSGILADTGELYAAGRAVRRALSLYQSNGNVDGQVSAWNQTGQVAWRLGFLPRAEHALRSGLGLAEESGSVHGRVLAENSLTGLLVEAGRIEEAAAMARATAEHARHIGDRHLTECAEVSQAQALAAAGHDAEALPLFQRLADAGGRESVLPLIGLARIRLRAGDLDRAAALARSAYEIASSYSLAWRAAVALVLRAEIALAAGDRLGARDLAEDARRRLARMGDRAAIARARDVLIKADRSDAGRSLEPA